MKRFVIFSTVSFFLLFFIVIFHSQITFAEEEAENTDDTVKRSQELQKEIEELTNKLNDTRSKKTTLTNQIVYMDTQIAITQLEVQKSTVRIAEIRLEVENLTDKILKLESSLDTISEVFIDRVVATFKSDQIPAILMLMSENGTSDLISRTAYLKRIQIHDKKLMIEVQDTKTDFEEQKILLEEKKDELDDLKIKLEAQSVALDQQKKDKENLLEITKNDEKNFQQLLSVAQAEYEAIQAIVAGKGIETKIGIVNEGDRIASVIQGPSCNSSGAHLHFIVRNNGGTVHNPFSYLKGIEHENCSGSSCGSGDADAFNPSGDWRWPIEPTIRLSQGYGVTWAVQHKDVTQVFYNFHNGIDISSTSSSTVYAVKGGTLYQGSYIGNNKCTLRYVRVDHEDSDLDTLYLHINY